MKSFIMRAVGVSQDDRINSLASLHKEQLKIVNNINNTLRSNTHCYFLINHYEYSRYVKFGSLLNKYLLSIQLEEFEEKPLKKWVKRLLISSFIIVAAANGYFVFKSFIVLVAGGIVGTPIGGAILASLLVGQLIARLVIRLESIQEILYPSEKELKEVKNKLDQLRDPTVDFENILSEKKKKRTYERDDSLVSSIKKSPDSKQTDLKEGRHEKVPSSQGPINQWH